jgi:hypothetical protein
MTRLASTGIFRQNYEQESRFCSQHVIVVLGECQGPGSAKRRAKRFIPCPPCFAEMGVLHKIYAEYAGNKDFCFITICMTDSAQVKAFIRQVNRFLRKQALVIWMNFNTD